MNNQTNRFWYLVEPEYLKARGFCHKLTGDPNDGDDLLQDALVRALTGFADLRHPAAFRGWLYRIIVNVFNSKHTRAKRPWYRRLLPLTPEVEDTIGDGDPIARHTARRRLQVAMAPLAPRDRALVTLFELEGWSLAELSELTGKSTGSLKTRLSRLRARMRQTLVRYLDGSPHEHSINGKETVCAATKPARD